MADVFCLIYDTDKKSISVKPLQYITSRNLVNVCRGCFAQQFVPIGCAESEDVAYQLAQETPLKQVIQHCLRETEEYAALKAERDRGKNEDTEEMQH